MKQYTALVVNSLDILNIMAEQISADRFILSKTYMHLLQYLITKT